MRQSNAPGQQVALCALGDLTELAAERVVFRRLRAQLSIDLRHALCVRECKVLRVARLSTHTISTMRVSSGNDFLVEKRAFSHWNLVKKETGEAGSEHEERTQNRHIPPLDLTSNSFGTSFDSSISSKY